MIKYMKQKLLFFVFSAILFGCYSGSKKYSTENLYVIDISKNYPKKEIRLQHIADIEYIPLETTDDALIGSSPALSYVSDKYIVIRDVIPPHSIFVFNRNGKIITHINHRGEGDKEYMSNHGVIFDEQKEEIFVREGVTNKILVYSLTGEYKRTLKPSNDLTMGALYNFDDSTMLAYNDYGLEIYYRNDLSKEYNERPYMLISKNDGSFVSFIDIRLQERYQNIIPEIIDIGGGQKMYTTLEINTPTNRRYGRDFVISDISSDTIYRFTQNRNLSPMLVRRPSVHSSEPRQVWTVLLTTDKFIVFQKVTLDFYASQSGKEIPAKTYFLDFETNEIQEVSFIDENYTMRRWNPPGSFSPEIPKNMDADLLWPPRLQTAYEENQLKGDLAELFTTLDVEDNPIVRIIKFR